MVLTQFNTASLHRHISQSYRFDGFSDGFLQILAAQQTIEDSNWYQGTADAVRKNIHYIKHQKVGTVVILSGDQLYRINLLDFMNHHREKKAEITIAVKPVVREQAGEFGILQIDDRRRIVNFLEVSRQPGDEKRPPDIGAPLHDAVQPEARAGEDSDGDQSLSKLPHSRAPVARKARGPLLWQLWPHARCVRAAVQPRATRGWIRWRVDYPASAGQLVTRRHSAGQ